MRTLRESSRNYKTYRSGRGTTIDVIMSGIDVPPGVILFEDPPLHDAAQAGSLKGFHTSADGGDRAADPPVLRENPRPVDRIGPVRFQSPISAPRFRCARSATYLAFPSRTSSTSGIGPTGPWGLKDGTLKTVSADMFENSYQLSPKYIDWRADHPSDDLMTQLLNAEIEEDGVSRPLTRTLEVCAIAASS